MSPSPLDQLQPLILPTEPGAWPPAIGWWLLMLIVITLLVISIKTLVNYWRFEAVKRQSLRKVKQTQCSDQLNRLLKITALHYFPNHHVAHLSGANWSTFLNHNLAPEHHQTCDFCCAMLYRPALAITAENAAAIEQQQKFQGVAIAWLTGLSRRKIKALKNV